MMIYLLTFKNRIILLKNVCLKSNACWFLPIVPDEKLGKGFCKRYSFLCTFTRHWNFLPYEKAWGFAKRMNALYN